MKATTVDRKWKVTTEWISRSFSKGVNVSESPSEYFRFSRIHNVSAPADCGDTGEFGGDGRTEAASAILRERERAGWRERESVCVCACVLDWTGLDSTWLILDSFDTTSYRRRGSLSTLLVPDCNCDLIYM